MNKLKLTTIVLAATLGLAGCKSKNIDTIESQTVNKATPYITITTYDSINGAKEWKTGTYLLMSNDDYVDVIYNEDSNWSNNRSPTTQDLEFLKNAIKVGDRIKYKVFKNEEISNVDLETYYKGMKFTSREIKESYWGLELLNINLPPHENY